MSEIINYNTIRDSYEALGLNKFIEEIKDNWSMGFFESDQYCGFAFKYNNSPRIYAVCSNDNGVLNLKLVNDNKKKVVSWGYAMQNKNAILKQFCVAKVIGYESSVQAFGEPRLKQKVLGKNFPVLGINYDNTLGIELLDYTRQGKSLMFTLEDISLQFADLNGLVKNKTFAIDRTITAGKICKIEKNKYNIKPGTRGIVKNITSFGSKDFVSVEVEDKRVLLRHKQIRIVKC
jgi:hypothetical protein